MHKVFTIAIDILIAFISIFVHVCVFLVIVFDGRTVVAGIAKVILIDVPLVHIGHQHTVILGKRCFSPREQSYMILLYFLSTSVSFVYEPVYLRSHPHLRLHRRHLQFHHCQHLLDQSLEQ